MNETLTAYLLQAAEKNATARVKVVSGSGKLIVNEKTLDEFFGGLDRQKKHAIEPWKNSLPRTATITR